MVEAVLIVSAYVLYLLVRGAVEGREGEGGQHERRDERCREAQDLLGEAHALECAAPGTAALLAARQIVSFPDQQTPWER